MRSLARPSFFHTFEMLLSIGNPGGKFTRWTHEGVDWERERHSFSGPNHGLTIDIYTLTRPGKRGWSILPSNHDKGITTTTYSEMKSKLTSLINRLGVRECVSGSYRCK